jgi:hypothetical protein
MNRGSRSLWESARSALPLLNDWRSPGHLVITCLLAGSLAAPSALGKTNPDPAREGHDATQGVIALKTVPESMQEGWRIVQTGESIELGPEFFIGLPGMDRPYIRAQWEMGVGYDVHAEHLNAVKVYSQLAHELPHSAAPQWRLARAYWRYSESLPPGEQATRLEYFLLADVASARGIEIDDECAECMLWRYASLGRLATTRGVVTAARDISTMAKLLERGIALNPQHSDGPYNSTLGNLYYASATFYRMVPDWFWFKWVLGVRGDKERALRDARTAVSMAEMRVDYQIELGASLLCLGERRENSAHVSEGEHVLRKAIDLPHLLPTDAIDQEYAKILLKRQDQACKFSRDGFIDTESASRQL